MEINIPQCEMLCSRTQLNKDFKELQVPGLVAPHAYIFICGYI